MLCPGFLCWFGDGEGLLIGVWVSNPRLSQESLVSCCLPSAVDAIRSEGSPVTGTPAGTVAVRASGLRVQGGTVLADAWLPDLARLGELERHLGDGVIEAAVDKAIAEGRLKPRRRRRIMSYPLVIRLMIAMTLMPDGSYCEALRRLAGLLADIPFTREWHIPTGKVVTDWRLPVPADLLEDLFWQAAGPLIDDGEPSAVLLAGMMVLAADGMLVNLADTPANRAFFGCTGTAGEDGEGAAPFPQLKIVALTARVKEGISLGFEDGPDRGWLPDGSRMTWLNAPSGKTEDRLQVRAAEHNA